MSLNFKMMKNPYLKAFLAFLNGLYQGGNDEFANEPNINFFDKIAFLYRFYPSRPLEKKIEIMIERGVKDGNLEVLSLMGLNHPKAPFLV